MERVLQNSVRREKMTALPCLVAALLEHHVWRLGQGGGEGAAASSRNSLSRSVDNEVLYPNLNLLRLYLLYLFHNSIYNHLTISYLQVSMQVLMDLGHEIYNRSKHPLIFENLGSLPIQIFKV